MPSLSYNCELLNHQGNAAFEDVLPRSLLQNRSRPWCLQQTSVRAAELARVFEKQLLTTELSQALQLIVLGAGGLFLAT